MELRQLQVFTAVAAELSFGRAADRLDTAQPAVSQTIRRLEDELGFALFERSSHHVALTAAGEALLPRAQAVLTARDDLERAAVGLRRGIEGTLRLGTVGAVDDVLQEVMSVVARELPDLDVAIVSSLVGNSLASVRDGELDAALVWQAEPIPGTRAVELASIPLLLTIGRAHPLAAATGPVELTELRGLPVALPPRQVDPAIHDAVRTWCTRAGFEVDVVSHDTLPIALAAVAASPRLWMLLPEVGASSPHITQLAMQDPEIAGSVRLITRMSGVSPATRTFVRVVEQLLSES